MIFCTKDSPGESEFPYYSLLSRPEWDIRDGMIARLGGYYPALYIRGVDPFITDYFNMLKDPL